MYPFGQHNASPLLGDWLVLDVAQVSAILSATAEVVIATAKLRANTKNQWTHHFSAIGSCLTWPKSLRSSPQLRRWSSQLRFPCNSSIGVSVELSPSSASSADMVQEHANGEMAASVCRNCGTSCFLNRNCGFCRRLQEVFELGFELFLFGQVIN